MTEATESPLVQRLDRLERELRWWKRLAGAAVAGLTLVVLLGAVNSKTVPAEIRAMRFVVDDGNGKELASLAGTGDSGALLSFYRSDGSLATSFGLLSTLGPQLLMSNEKRTESVWLTPGDLVLKGQRDETTVSADGLHVGQPLDGQPSATYGSSSLGFLDAQFKVRAALGVSKDGAGLELSDANGQTRAVLGTTEIETVSTKARTRMPESALTLFDKDGKVLWKAP